MIIDLPRDLWSAEAQRLVRESQPGDVLRIPATADLSDQFQLLGGATTIDARGSLIRIHPSAGKAAGFLLRDKPTVRVIGGTYLYAPAGDNPTHIQGVLYFIDVGTVQVLDARIQDVYGADGIHVDARTVVSSPYIAGTRIQFYGEGYRTTHHVGIRLKSTLRFAPGTSTPNESTRAGTTPTPVPTARVVGGEISGCHIIGGYYGIGASGWVSGTVRHCTTLNNERGMSFQDGSEGLSVTGCGVYNNRSAGIHLAYGTINSRIDSCLVTSSNNNGEAMIQAYVGTQNNVIINCAVHSTNGPTHAYQGALGGLLTVQGSTARMKGVAKALVASEYAWDPTVQQAWHSRSNAPAEARGLERAGLTNHVLVRDCTLVCDAPYTVAAVNSDVLGTGKSDLSIIESTVVATGGSSVLTVGTKQNDLRTSVTTDSTGGAAEVSRYVAEERGTNRFNSSVPLLRQRFGFGAVGSGGSNSGGGGGSPGGTSPGPSPAIDMAGTLTEGTATRQLVAFITRPQQSNQYGDWVAFMEVHNGNVVTWPESVQIPQWTGKRGFPAIILPRNGQISGTMGNFTRTYVELESTGHIANHPTIRGVQWFARTGMDIANPNMAQERIPGGSQPVQINESPANYAGTVGEVCPSGIATFVWVQDAGSTMKVQFVTIRDGIPVPNPGHTDFTTSITFSEPRGFPAIVYPGKRLPADGKLRNLTRSYITMPTSASGQTGVIDVPQSAISNANPGRLKAHDGTLSDLAEATVAVWFGETGGGSSAGSGIAGVSTSSRVMIDRALAGMRAGHDIAYQGWTRPARGTNPNRGAQVRGGSVTIGGTFRIADVDHSGSLWRSKFDMHNAMPDHVRDSIQWEVADQLQMWACIAPAVGSEGAAVDVADIRIFVKEKGATVYKLLDRIQGRSTITWGANQGPSMNPGDGTDNAYIRNTLGLSTNATISHHDGFSRTYTPANAQLNNHFGYGDPPIKGKAQAAGIDLANIDSVLGLYTCRLAPESKGKVVGIQLGFDPKWNTWRPGPGMWFPGLMLSRFQRVPDDWGLVGVVNVNTAGDAERGGVVLSADAIRGCTIEGYEP